MLRNYLIASKFRLIGYSTLVGSFNDKIVIAVVQKCESKQSHLIEAKWNCIEFVTERFQFYLQAHEDKNGLIIADFPGNWGKEKKIYWFLLVVYPIFKNVFIPQPPLFRHSTIPLFLDPCVTGRANCL